VAQVDAENCQVASVPRRGLTGPCQALRSRRARKGASELLGDLQHSVPGPAAKSRECAKQDPIEAV
jgi:hypothetical protein